jgi:hypothetical protein
LELPNIPQNISQDHQRPPCGLTAGEMANCIQWVVADDLEIYFQERLAVPKYLVVVTKGGDEIISLDGCKGH